MTSIARTFIGAALVVVFVLVWGARTDRDVVGAQTPKTITVTRIFTHGQRAHHARGRQRGPHLDCDSAGGSDAWRPAPVAAPGTRGV
ncbi:MAG: hypothetical protein HYU37_22180 [Acidobacteria bacterium]|nr:hypothetical protein [Acidobacteriota bacterium]